MGESIGTRTAQPADLRTRERGEPRSRRTAERLRDAAQEAFAELGWQATRVQDIVERAGVSHGTFYTYYENKSGLLADLVHASLGDLVALASDAWTGEDNRAALETIIGGLVDLYARDATVMRTWLEAARDEGEFSELYVTLRGQFVERVADNLRDTAQAAGRTHGPPPGSVASALVAMVEHFAYCWLVLGEDHDRDDVVAALVLVWGSTLNALAGFEVVEVS